MQDTAQRPDIETIFRESRTGWFRARTYHEHGIIARYLRNRVNFSTSRILDFGCGALPIAAASIALRYPDARVVGTDIALPDRERMAAVLKQEAGLQPPKNLTLHQVEASTLPESLGQFDIIYAWSVFEHIPASEIETCFRLIGDRLAPKGVFFFQIGGLYHSNIGSRLGPYLGRSWLHLILSLAEIRARIGSSDAPQRKQEREWQQFLELNRLTVDDFMDAAKSAGLCLVLKEELTDGEPPSALLRSYTRTALTTNEVRAIFTR